MRPAILILALTLASFAQDATDKQAPAKSDPAPSSAPSDGASQSTASSSRDTRIDLSPPKDDAKSHPESESAVADIDVDSNANPDNTGVQEFHPWSPLKASKDIEVGDFYFKRKNYKAALERYKEALYYKDGDAVANFRIGECQEKLGNKAEAQKYYEQYLKILPEGPLAKGAHASLARIAKAQ